MGKRRCGRTAILGVSLAALVIMLTPAASTWAVHESTNTVVFESPAGVESTTAGEGVIEYRGGGALDSRWTVQLRFLGLVAGTQYVAVVQGRFGAVGEPRGDEFTELCSFQSSATGEGGCWWYLVQMQQLNIVQLRLGAVDGAPVLQATRAEGGPGSISSQPNAFSPSEATPVASLAASPFPVGSPTAG